MSEETKVLSTVKAPNPTKQSTTIKKKSPANTGLAISTVAEITVLFCKLYPTHNCTLPKSTAAGFKLWAPGERGAGERVWTNENKPKFLEIQEHTESICVDRT